MKLRTTVYIPAHNYGKYLRRAVSSVLNQKFHDWELIIINDGSTDNTREVLVEFNGLAKLKVMHQEKKGLAVTNNIALRLAQGKYIMRLDADDYLDENALLVLSNILDRHPEIGLVYPDYYLVDEDGEILELVRRKKIGEEAGLLDIPAHGACSMIRKECLLQLGGYNEKFKCRDGYDLWLRFIRSFRPYNVNTPLFYYRQHSGSITNNKRKMLSTEGIIKRHFNKNLKENKIPSVMAVIPVVKRSETAADMAFNKLAGKPLIWYTVSEALKSKLLDRIVVTSDDQKVLEYCSGFKKIIPVKRPPQLALSSTRIVDTLLHTLGELKEKHSYVPEAVMVLYINTPLRNNFHIDKSIDSMVIFSVDTVLSVNEEADYFYCHQKYGLAPLNKRKGISLEREALYRGNGAITLTRTSSITGEGIIGEKVGHIIMLPEESVRIRNSFELWQAGKIISDWRDGSACIRGK